MAPPRKGEIQHFFNDGAAVSCSGVEIGVIHTPGHTPGSTTFVLPGDRNILFAGDTLFMGGIRLEDVVLVTKTGCENLVHLPKILEV